MNTTSSTTRNKRAAWCAGDVAQQVAGRIHVGSPAREVATATSLSAAGPDTVTFIDHARALRATEHSPPGTLLVTEALSRARAWDAETTTVIVCARPRLAMARLVAQLMPTPPAARGISPQAHIDPTAQVHPEAHVGPGAVVAAFAAVDAHAQVGPLCYVGDGAHIGAHAVLHPGAKVLWGCTVGDHSILHAGCVIGADGFGFVPDDAGEHVKVPQVGCVVLGEHVEVGANTTIDRATFGETRIGAGVKLDNLVQIGHNVVVGEHCLIVSQSGIAGSTTLGHHVVVGAQGGIVGHIHVAPHTQLAARAGVIGSIETPGVYAGAPAMEHRAWLRMVAAQRDLVALRRRVASLAEVMHPAEKAP